MNNLLVLVYSLLFYIVNSSNSSLCNFRFGSMVLLTGDRPRFTVAAGFNMALEDYKNGYLYNNTYLNLTHLAENNCIINTNMHDMKSDIRNGIVAAFEFGQSFTRQNKSDINIPIVVGPSTSGYSLTLNPLFSAFNLLQFSSTATSTFLSEYDSFFRSVPSDDLQANALIQLCKYFEWKVIGIMYMNTNYGSSLQKALTSYAKMNDIESTTFSYIDGDNITISDAVGSMKKSKIYINILIAYGSDLQFITSQLILQDMVGYPYYFLATDSWLAYIGEDSQNSAQNIQIYGGIIGTCPWSPAINDPFQDKYSYPINETIKIYIQFYKRWLEYYKASSPLLYNYSEPGLFTGYAYDNVLTVIKSINEYIKQYGYSNENMTARFAEILRSISFIGLTGNVSYDVNGDRLNGLFSFCNVDILTGEANTIGYVIQEKNLSLSIVIDEDLIEWPTHYDVYGIPQYEYIKYKGIPNELFIIVYVSTALSILFTLICMFLLAFYKQRQIIKSSQWRLSIIMCCGIILTYICIFIYGIDERIVLKMDMDYNIYCNYRVIFFNTAFGLTFGPLFCKVYRIRMIFSVGKKLKKTVLTDTKMAVYNLIYVFIDFLVCLILIFAIPQSRRYNESATYEIEKEFYGNCSTQYWYIYGLILIIPKFIFCIYSIIISVSVYNTVSMMKYNEGLQVLMTVVITVTLVLMLLIILSVTSINSERSASFSYGFLALILLMLCNFCIVMMIVPRLAAIWRNMEDEYIEQDNKGQNKLNKYLVKLAKFRRKNKDSSRSITCTEQSIELSSKNSGNGNGGNGNGGNSTPKPETNTPIVNDENDILIVN